MNIPTFDCESIDTCPYGTRPRTPGAVAKASAGPERQARGDLQADEAERCGCEALPSHKALGQQAARQIAGLAFPKRTGSAAVKATRKSMVFPCYENY